MGLANDNLSGERKRWEPPAIRPLPRLSERNTPTIVSASSPDQHTSDLSDVERLFWRHGDNEGG